MPRYFFHIHDSADFPDEDGTELADEAAAKEQAVITAGELLKELGGQFWDGADWRLRVVREDGTQLCELEFSAKV